jgi:oligopeptidase B
VDFTGGETYLVWIKNIATGEIVEHDDQLETSGNLVWGKDDSTLFYMKMDSNHRPYQLYRRTIGASSTSDQLLLEEKDDMMYSHISKSLDGKYLFMESASKETSEIWYLDLHDKNAQMQCIAKRRDKVLYEANHRHDTFWISTNVGGSPNMKLMTCPVKPNGQDDWKLVEDQSGQPLFDGSYDKALEDVSEFDSHVVLSGRQQGIPRVWILDPATATVERLEFDEPGHDVGLSANHEFVTDSIAITYDSMVTPPQTMEISLANPSASADRKVLKAKHVPGYNKELYACDRLTVPSRDGETQIPISLVYRKDVMEQAKDTGQPTHTHLYGYGSYGSSIEADFRSTRLPLLDRGVIYVIAHIRGGGEMGRQWYEEPKGAKYLCKKNTFNDFVDVARWLIETKKLTTPDLLSCEGRSAGGMLVGSSINQAPELFKCAMLGVPFVDVVCTMIDASIPLTALEWVEWVRLGFVLFLEERQEHASI